MNQAQQKRIEIFNKLIAEKKSFILLIESKECEAREYSVLEGTEKILKQNKYSYLKISTPTLNGDQILEKSDLDTSKLGGGIPP